MPSTPVRDRGAAPAINREVWTHGAPQSEALSLFALIGRNGDDVASIRQLIAVPPEVEGRLRGFAGECRECAQGIERTLEFRRAVLAEFERLVRHGQS